MTIREQKKSIRTATIIRNQLTTWRTMIVFFLLVLVVADVSAQSRKKARYRSLLRLETTGNPDPLANAADLVAETKKVCAPSEYDYFRGLYEAGYFLQDTHPVKAIEYLEEARSIYLKEHQNYVDDFEKDFDSKYVSMLTLLFSANINAGTSAGLSQIPERDYKFAQTFCRQHQCEYLILLGTTYTIDRLFNKAEESLWAAKAIIDSPEPFTNLSQTGSRSERESAAKIDKDVRDSYRMRYDMGRSSLMRLQGNSKAADSLLSKTGEEAKKKIAETPRRKVPGPAGQWIERWHELFVDFFGVAPGSPEFLQQITTTSQTLPEKEPAGYIAKIRYYLQKSDDVKCTSLLADARKRLKDYERKPIDTLTTRPLKDALSDLEAILEMSKGNYAPLISSTRRPLRDLDATLRDLVPFLSEKDLRSFFDKYQRDLTRYLSALSFSDKPEDAIKLLEKSVGTRGLLLSVSKERGRIFQQSTSDPSVTSDLVKMRNYRDRFNFFVQQTQLSPSESDIDSLQYFENEVTKLQRVLVKKLMPYELKTEVPWKQMQQKLKPGECFVSIQQLQREYFAQSAVKLNNEYWIIYFDSQSPYPVLHKIGDAIDLGKGMRYYQNMIKSTLVDELSYDLYWKPIAEATHGQKRIYFSTDGMYHLINPYTLFNTKEHRYVLDEIEVIRVNHPASFEETKLGPLQVSQSMAFIGNPDFAVNRKDASLKKVLIVDPEVASTQNGTAKRSGLVPLPGAEEEVTRVSQLAGKLGFPVLQLSGGKATEGNVKAIVNPSVLHFATHGVFQTGQFYDTYLRSKLVLAGVDDGNNFTPDDYKNFDDGWLTATEVIHMNLQKTRLVVLSACETALGEIQAGEGVYGLQRAFELAGAKNVLGSLWKIDDQATSTFMIEFYNSYLTNGDILSAYQKAMNQTRKKFPHPYFWGGFVLNGN